MANKKEQNNPAISFNSEEVFFKFDSGEAIAYDVYKKTYVYDCKYWNIRSYFSIVDDIIQKMHNNYIITSYVPNYLSTIERITNFKYNSFDGHPSIIEYDISNNNYYLLCIMYHKDGKIHKEDGPAFVQYDKDGKEDLRYYYLDGKRTENK